MSGRTAKRLRRMAEANGWTRFQYQAAKRSYKRDEHLIAPNGASIPIRLLVQSFPVTSPTSPVPSPPPGG